MLKTRIKTAAVLAAIIIPVLLCADIPYVMDGFAAALSLAGVYELFHCIDVSPADPWRVLALFGAVLIPIVGIPCRAFVLPFTFPLIVLCFLMVMLRMDEMPRPNRWVIFLLSLTVPLFFSGLSLLCKTEFGKYYLFLMVLVCVATDAAAYFVGRAKGRHKLAPSVSPSKTIEGALGGTVTAMVSAILLCVIIELATGLRVHYPAVMLYAVSTSVVSQIGDLSMSVIKRLVGIKDFSQLLPGHGGILDRFDSQLFAAPFTLIFVESICPLFVR